MMIKGFPDPNHCNTVRKCHPTAKAIEVGDALRKPSKRGDGYGWYIVAHRRALGRKGRTEKEAWKFAFEELEEK